VTRETEALAFISKSETRSGNRTEPSSGLVELVGIEPTTSALQRRRSPS
jgi:hypothetical protein